MSLTSFVSLYRHVGMPVIGDDYIISFTIEVDEAFCEKVSALHGYGSFESILDKDERDLNIEEIKNHLGEMISIEFYIPRTGGEGLYRSLDDLLEIENGSLSAGVFPTQYYIADLDCFSEENNDVALVRRMKSICRLINGLSELAHYHDNKTGHQLVFVGDIDAPQTKSIVIKPYIKKNFLVSEMDNSDFLNDIINASDNPNIGREKAVFRSSLIEFVNGRIDSSEDSFQCLIKGWKDFFLLYQKNFDTYISGFAFHKARKEVAEAELSIADQFSKVIGDITGKLLGIPVSFAAIAGFYKVTGFVEQIFFVAGLLIASVIMCEMIVNQNRQLKRITHAKNVIFNKLDGNALEYPDELKSVLESVGKNLDQDAKQLQYTLSSFRVIGWIPSIIAAMIFVNIYWLQFKSVWLYYIVGELFFFVVVSCWLDFKKK